MNFKAHIFSLTLILLISIAVTASFYKYVILEDYIVSYEGECDPEIYNCFVDCVDDECTEEYYYTAIERHANEIYALCGDDITDCEAANYCPTNIAECSVTYCDPVTNGDACESINSN